MLPTDKLFTIKYCMANDVNASRRFRSMIWSNGNYMYLNPYNQVYKKINATNDNEIISFINNNFTEYTLAGSSNFKFANDIVKLLSFLTFDSFKFVFKLDRNIAIMNSSYDHTINSITYFPLIRFSNVYEININNYLKGNADKYIKCNRICNLMRPVNYFRMRPFYFITEDFTTSGKEIFEASNLSNNKILISKEILNKFDTDFRIMSNDEKNQSIEDLFYGIEFIDDVFNLCNSAGTRANFENYLSIYKNEFKTHPSEWIISKDNGLLNYENTSRYNRNIIVNKPYISYNVIVDKKTNTFRLFVLTDGIYANHNYGPDKFLENVGDIIIKYISEHIDDKVICAVANYNALHSKTAKNFDFINYDLTFYGCMKEYTELDKDIDISCLKDAKDKYYNNEIRHQSILFNGINSNDSYDIMTHLIESSYKFSQKIYSPFDPEERW